MGQPQISGRQVGIENVSRGDSSKRLRDLRDVSIASAQDGDVLTFKGGVWKPLRHKQSPRKDTTPPVENTNKTNAKVAIDEAAERARMRYLTPGAGQAQVYLEKVEEAADYIAADYPSDYNGYPYIQAEVEVTDKTARQVADDIITAKSVWQAVSVQIEKARLGGKKAIEEATNTQDIKSVRNSTVASLDAI